MAFRIKDLMIAVVAPEAPEAPDAPRPLLECTGVSLPHCEVTGQGCAFSLPQCGFSCGLSRPQCGLSLPNCGRSMPNCNVSLFGGCGNEYTCNGCTNSCDAGCSRVQCSNYPTKSFPAKELADLQAAQLALLRAELRLAQEAVDRAGPVEALQSPEDIDILEKHLVAALEELRAERARLDKKSKDLDKKSKDKEA